jgi:hypothetical protein
MAMPSGKSLKAMEVSKTWPAIKTNCKFSTFLFKKLAYALCLLLLCLGGGGPFKEKYYEFKD